MSSTSTEDSTSTADATEVTTAQEAAAPEARRQLDPAHAARRDAAAAFAKEAAQLCADLKCRDVKVLDVAGLSPVTDIFLIATGGSARQMTSVAMQVGDLARERNISSMHSMKRGDADERWIAIDLFDIVVHLFSEEAREYYDLDHLWGEADEVQWFDPDRDGAR